VLEPGVLNTDPSIVSVVGVVIPLPTDILALGAVGYCPSGRVRRPGDWERARVFISFGVYSKSVASGSFIVCTEGVASVVYSFRIGIW